MAWSPEQLSNAKVIINVGRQLGASDRDILIALMAGWQESGLRNLNYGDRDSIGMFQQRNAWGSRQDRLDPVKSTRMFFLGGAQGQRGLLDFKNRDQWDLGQAAQKVQVSAFPDAYDKWQDESEQLLKELGGSADHPRVPVEQKPTGITDPTEMSSPAQQQGSAALTALGVASPTSTGLEAAGAGAATMPGLESADETPQFNLDLTGMVDPDLPNMMNIPKELQGGFELPEVPSDDSYSPGNYNLPRVKSWVVAAANELGGRFGIKTIGGYGHRPNATDHDDGLALDFMVRGKTGSQLASFAMQHAKRLKVKYIIWDQHIWSAGRAGEGWRKMEDRGGDTANHVDHVHISFT